MPLPTRHLLADLPVIPLPGLRLLLLPDGELLVVVEGDAVDAGEHLVFPVVLPIGAGLLGDFEGLEGLGVGQVGTNAHIDIVTLLIEGDPGVLREVADVLHLVDLAAGFHQGDGLVPGQLVGLDGQVLLADLLHLSLDGLKVLVGELLLSQIHVVVEATLRSRAVGELRLGMQPPDRLGHDVGGGVPDHMKFLFLFDLRHMAVVVQYFHILHSFENFTMVFVVGTVFSAG